MTEKKEFYFCTLENTLTSVNELKLKQIQFKTSNACPRHIELTNVFGQRSKTKNKSSNYRFENH
jgi:hypothetical protein